MDKEVLYLLHDGNGKGMIFYEIEDAIAYLLKYACCQNECIPMARGSEFETGIELLEYSKFDPELYAYIETGVCNVKYKDGKPYSVKCPKMKAYKLGKLVERFIADETTYC